jgi:hypothetical protein
MKHLTEEDLIGQTYGEGASGAAAHLDGCAECARSYAELKSDLSEIDRLAEFDREPSHRDEAYGEQVWRAIAGSLPLYGTPRRRWFGIGVVRGLSYAAICALLVAGAFYAGRQWEIRKPAVTAGNIHPQAKQPIVLVVLGDHLDRSERLLVELKHVDAGNTEMVSPLRDEARSLLAANHVCRKNAEKTGDPALEGALDHLDHLLTEIADQPGGLDAASIARIKNEMNADGLLFEVRVLRSRTRDQRPAGATHLNGGTI